MWKCMHCKKKHADMITHCIGCGKPKEAVFIPISRVRKSFKIRNWKKLLIAVLIILICLVFIYLRTKNESESYNQRETVKAKGNSMEVILKRVNENLDRQKIKAINSSGFEEKFFVATIRIGIRYLNEKEKQEFAVLFAKIGNKVSFADKEKISFKNLLSIIRKKCNNDEKEVIDFFENLFRDWIT